MQVAVIDPTPQILNGHNLTSLMLLADLPAPLEPDFFVHVDSSPDALELLNHANASFLKSPYDLKYWRKVKTEEVFKRRLKKIISLLFGSKQRLLDGSYYCDDLVKIISNYGPDDHIICPTAMVDILISVVEVIEREVAEKLPFIHMRFLDFPDDADRPLAIAGHRRLAAQSRKNSKIKVYTETEILARYLEKEFSYKLVERSILQPPAVSGQNGSQEGTAPVNVGYLCGTFREDKGAERISNIIAGVARELKKSANSANIRFTIQDPPPEHKNNLEDMISLHKDLDGGAVLFIPGRLGLKEFSEFIASCDIILLPYSVGINLVYRGSGIAFDAAINGVPIISTPITGIMEIVGEDGGRIVDTDENIARAIVEISTDLDKFKAGAALNSKRINGLVEDNHLTNTIRDCFKSAAPGKQR